MVQELYTFPQDHGTDAYPDQEGDPNDAANFGSLVGATQTHSALIRGMTFSNVDYTNLTFDVDAGKVYLVGDGITAASSGENRNEVALVNGFPAQTGKSLTDSAVNHVFAATDPDTNDAPYVAVNTTGSAPADPSVKIGEIDTTNDVASEQWNLLQEDGTLSYPDANAANTALNNLGDAVTVYDRTNDKQIVDGKLSADTLEADSAVISNRDVADVFTRLSTGLGKTRFDIGLQKLNYDDGWFDILEDESLVDTKTDVEGFNGSVTVATSVDYGQFSSPLQTIDFVPSSVVVGHDVDVSDSVTAANQDSFDYTVLSGFDVTSPVLGFTGSKSINNRAVSYTSTGSKSINISGNADPESSSTDTPQITASTPTTKTKSPSNILYYSECTIADWDDDGVDELIYQNSNDLYYYDYEDESSTLINTFSSFDSIATIYAIDYNGSGSRDRIFVRLDPGSTPYGHYYYDKDGSFTQLGSDSDNFRPGASGVIFDNGGEGVVGVNPNNGDALAYIDSSGNLQQRSLDDPVQKVNAGNIEGEDDFVFVGGNFGNKLYTATVSDGSQPYQGDQLTDRLVNYAPLADFDGDGYDEVVVEGGSGDKFGYYDPIDGNFVKGELAVEPTSGDDDGDTRTIYNNYGVVPSNSNDPIFLGEVYDSSESTGYIAILDPMNGTIEEINVYYGSNGFVARGDFIGSGERNQLSALLSSGDVRFKNVATSTTVDIDVGDDGNVDVSFSLDSNNTSETKPQTIPLSTSSIGITATNGLSNLEIDLQEITETVNPSVTLNSTAGTQTLSHTGTLANGETADVSDQIDPSLLSGDVTVDVAVSESTSSPVGQVGLDYNHDGFDAGGMVVYEIEDADGNTVTVEEDVVADIAASSQDFKITPVIQDGLATAELYDYAVYFD